MKQTEKDIEAASLIIEGKEVKEPYQKIYCTQTENSKELFKRLSHHWENSLFIGGSADQFLNAILYRSRNLTVVDSNPLAIHYILLKLAALKVLDNKEFLEFTSWNPKENTDLEQLLKLLTPLLERDYPYFNHNPVQFWDTIFKNYSKEEIAKKLFFDESTEYEKHDLKKEMLLRNPYLEKRFFNYLRKVIPSVSIQVVNQDILKLASILNLPQFDKIYLSNILLEMDISLEEYQHLLEENIYPLLSLKGEAVISYLNISHSYGITLNKLGTTDQIVKFFTEHDCRSELMFNLNISNQVHTAFVYQKK